jgi:hypothetical protein
MTGLIYLALTSFNGLYSVRMEAEIRVTWVGVAFYLALVTKWLASRALCTQARELPADFWSRDESRVNIIIFDSTTAVGIGI